MRLVIFSILAFVALSCVYAKLKCVKRDCFKWAGCTATYNQTSCRCESVCEKSDPECGPEPCLQNGFCFALRKKCNKCKCTNVCKDPPFCPWGYKKCMNHLLCMCKDKPVSEELMSSSDEEMDPEPSIMMPKIGLVLHPVKPKCKKAKKTTTPRTTTKAVDVADFDYIEDS
jgi:hypothetical protein